MGRLSQRLRFSRGFYVTFAVALFLAAVAAGVTGYLRLTTPPDEQTYIPKPEVITPEIELLQRYVRIDTSNPPGRELRGAQFLIDELRRGGVEGELIESAPGRANVYARIRGEVPNQGLLLLHHIDVVPANPAGWSKPPFGAEVALNQLWGRGTLDMKSIGVCHLQAFLSVAQSGTRPKRDLVFLATADEETGGKLGTAWLLQHRPDVFQGIRFAINEGGVPEMKAEKLTYFGIEVGSKQFVKLRVHASAREPLEKGRIALEPYIEPFDPERVLPQVKEFFRAIAPYRVHGQAVLEDVEAALQAGEFWRLQSTFRALTQNNIVPFGIGEQSGGFGMDVYLHNLPDEPPARAVNRIRRILSPYAVQVEVIDSMGPTRISTSKTEAFELLRALVKRYYGSDTPVGPMILGYATNDSRYLRTAGIDCYGLWPFPVDFHQSQGVHGPDERVRLDWFMQGIGLTRDFVRAYCSPS